MDIDPKAIASRDVYRLLIGGVLPRPIAWVSTIAPDGTPSLAPFSFFTVVCENPPTLCVVPARRGSDGGRKDTLVNIEATGEFVVNIVGETLADAMNLSAAAVGPEVDEFALAGLETTPSVVVRPPRVTLSPVAYECQLDRIVHVGGEVPGAGSLVLGTVVRIHVADEAWDNGRILTDVARQIGRGSGDDYIRTTDRFRLARPVVAPDGTITIPPLA